MSVQYVAKDAQGNKTIRSAEKTGSVYSGVSIGPGENGKVTLIDLSDAIDMLGMSSTMPEWNEKYRAYDMNGDGQIDIRDIVIIARMLDEDRTESTSVKMENAA